MDILNSAFDQHVASTGTPRYRHVSEGFAKHLAFEHPYSTKRSPADQSGGQNPSGAVFCVDGIFAAKPRNAAFVAKNGGAADYPASTEVIAMCEWPTQARIHGIVVKASLAAESPLSANLNYFDAGTAATFPAFTLQANDPNDPNFVPIPLRHTDGTISLAAIAFGVNRRANPLIIECVLGGAVVANSLLAVYVEFVKPHL